MHRLPRWALVVLTCLSAWSTARAETLFLEAESFKPSSDGWRVISGETSVKQASGTAVLNGSSGPADAVATAPIVITERGPRRIWVRHSLSQKWRGPFRLAVMAAGREIAGADLDLTPTPVKGRVYFIWSSFDVDLAEGEYTLELSKYQHKNCTSLARSIDCVLVTSDLKLVPNHLLFGTPTFLRVTFSADYDRPLYLHVFADHFHAPWYQHFSLAHAGAVASVNPKKGDLLKPGEPSPWCDITPMLYQDSGAALNLSARYAYTDRADHLHAKLEFATAPDAKAVVRTIDADCRPNGMVIYLPPNLSTPEHRALFKTDREIADETGRVADAFNWPTYGKKPERFPFFVSAHMSSDERPFDAAVADREQKTLDYFGFTPRAGRTLSGSIWSMLDQSYCAPDVAKMKTRAAANAKSWATRGLSLKDVVYCQLTDEPTGQPLSAIVTKPSYVEPFRDWLKKLGLTPAELLVADWDAVKPVTEAQRDQFPSLYYFSQRFRTRALGDFMATQRRVLEEAYGGPLRTLANFSDGAIYAANFYNQGVDYFELLSSPDHNAIWGEDWANGSSTYQCASFNIDLMRAASREHGQTIGHYLIAHAGRKAWDVKLKATSELARGVKILNSFSYGPSWASHEGGPYWRSHAWYAKPEMWSASAELTREVGAAEDMLVTAMPVPAKVAILYSSASDAWTLGNNLATGFDRMHTWLALAHAQTPVDIVSEQQAAAGVLDGYRVCYLSGPNLTRAAAAKLRAWVESGGTLWLTPGAASRDEYNRPITLLDPILPADRGEAQQLQAQLGSGRTIDSLTARDEVRWDGGAAEVLSVKQPLTPHTGAEVLATFKDKSAAVVTASAGRGRVYAVGFLPGLAYIKTALAAKKAAGDDQSAILTRSANPWAYPADLRQFMLTPVRSAGVTPPVTCDVPLVDTVLMACDKGLLIPLANYTLAPLPKVSLTVAVGKPVSRVESARHGNLEFTQSSGSVAFTLPLDANDFVKLYDR